MYPTSFMATTMPTASNPSWMASIVLAGLFTLQPSAQAQAPVTAPSPQIIFSDLAKTCAPNVHPDTLKALVSVESAGNPYAIGVVNGTLKRQPKTLPEAVATAKRLESKGFNFSLGLSQVNRYNLAKYGETYESIFEPCRNLKTGASILTECYSRALPSHNQPQEALRAALSCYYSGNFTRGFKPDSAGQPSYVQKVVKASGNPDPIIPKIEAIASDKEGVPLKEGAGPSQSRQNKPANNWVLIHSTNPVGPSTVQIKIKKQEPQKTSETPFVQFLE